jgi:hypothetical protein
VGGPVVGAVQDVVTAARLSEMSVEEIARVLEGLADFASSSIQNRLYRGLERTRD